MSLPTQRRPAPPERVRSGRPQDFWDPFGVLNFWDPFGVLNFWDPFGVLTQMWNRTEQLLPIVGARVPAVEEEETDDAYLVRADLAGMRRENVHVELGGGELRVAGEVKEENRGAALRRSCGRFAYRTSLPADFDAEKTEANLSDGVLTVRLPKTSQSQDRTIQIGD